MVRRNIRNAAVGSTTNAAAQPAPNTLGQVRTSDDRGGRVPARSAPRPVVPGPLVAGGGTAVWGMPFGRDGSRAATRNPPPHSGPAVNEPPSRAIRSSRPTSPLRLPGCGWRPSR
ncbi:hypothetical protein, partial [Streptomyces sp. NPDC056730]|uniref:hypothetical protein n=1 Tax=Streptomyces sp. NPDC056730 TaxID=3345929 RepID=UPI00369622E1